MSSQIVQNIQHTGVSILFRSLLLGAGFAHAIREENYLHLPVAFLIPATYFGYQLCKKVADVYDTKSQ